MIVTGANLESFEKRWKGWEEYLRLSGCLASGNEHGT